MARWQLELGGEVVAHIDSTEYEFPWMYGQLVNSPNFDRFRMYFSDPDQWPETPEFEALCAEISGKGGFFLRDVPAGTVYRSVTLNQDQNVVWFRFGEAAIETRVALE